MRVAVIGLGAMGKNHARVLSKFPEVELVGLIDPVLAGSVIHSVTVSGELEDVRNLELDYAVVSVPTASHYSVARFLAEIGVSCLIEKPIAGTLEEANDLVSLFSSNNLIGSIGHIERFNPAIKAMHEKISEGMLGEIYQISTRRLGPYPGRIRDVGVVKDLATHDIDLCRWLTGAEYHVVHSVSHSIGDHVNEDLLSTTGTMTNGVLFNHLINWVSPFKERSTAILGEKGLLVADTLNVELRFHENGSIAGDWPELTLFKGVSEGNSTKYALVRDEPLRVEHENFISRLNGDSSALPVSLGDGLAALEVAERMLHASK